MHHFLVITYVTPRIPMETGIELMTTRFLVWIKRGAFSGCIYAWVQQGFCSAILSQNHWAFKGAAINRENDRDSYTENPAEHLSPVELMEPHNSELSVSVLDGDRLPRSNALYSTSYGDGVGASNIPYDPDVPRPGNRWRKKLSRRWKGKMRLQISRIRNRTRTPNY